MTVSWWIGDNALWFFLGSTNFIDIRLAWDATCTDLFSTSNLCSTILSPGSVSSAAEDLKIWKYSQLMADFEFVPVAVETSGIIGSAGCSLLSDIGRRIARTTNDPCHMSYFFKLISVDIIWSSALAITASSRRYAQELVVRHWHSKWRCIVLFYYWLWKQLMVFHYGNRLY